MIGWEYPPNITGGLGTACQGLAQAMSMLPDVEVTFVLPTHYRGEHEPAVNFIFLPDSNTSNQVNRSTCIKAESASDWPGTYSGAIIPKVESYSDRMLALAESGNDFDIIHAHDWLTAPAALRLKELTGKPVILHIHSTEYDRAGSLPDQEIVRIEQASLNSADFIVAVSRFTKACIIRDYGIEEGKISVVYNACNTDRQLVNSGYRKKKSGIKIITFLGRITLQKGPRYFVEAAIVAGKENHNLQFVLAGTGDLLVEMKCLVEKSGMLDRFYFPGFLDPDEVNHLLLRSDIYVMPSVSEPFGISALEAVQAGVPTILSRQSGVSEIISNFELVDFSDVTTIASSILYFAGSDDAREKLATGAHKELETISWNKSAEELRAIYANCHARRTGGTFLLIDKRESCQFG